MEDAIYCLVKGNYPKDLADGEYPVILDFHGTCFFVNDSTFYAADHMWNSTSYIDDGTRKTLVFLVNANGHVINNPKILSSDMHKEIVIGESDMKPQSYIKNVLFSDDIDSEIVGKACVAYGFPKEDNLQKRFTIKIKNGIATAIDVEHPNLKNINASIFMIHTIDDNPFISEDGVEIRNHKVIFINNQTKLGYSGGPLFLEDGTVIGVNSQNSVKLSNDIYTDKEVSLAVTIPVQ